MRALAALAALAAAASDLLRSFCSPAWDIFSTAEFLGPTAATGYGTMQYQNTRDYSPQYAPVQEAPAINNDIDYRSLTMMDRSFDPNQFLKASQDIFFKIQGAWNKQDTAALSSLMWIRVDANMGAGVEQPKGSRSAEQNGKYRPSGKRDHRSMDGKRPRFYYRSSPCQFTRLYGRSKKRKRGQR